MKISRVSPERICIPGNVIREDGDIKGVIQYYDAFMAGRSVDPSFAVQKKWFEQKKFEEEAKSMGEEELDDFYDSLSAFTSQDYLGVERFHRMIGSTLAKGIVPVFEIRNNRDLAKLLKDVKLGKIEDYPHPETTVQDLANSAVEYYLGFCEGTFYSALETTRLIVEGAIENHFEGGSLREDIVTHWNTTIRPRFERLLI